MKSITIKGSQRESVGKAASKALRNAGQVPCVLYGGDNVLHFSAPELAFKNIVYTPNVYTAAIELNGKTYNAILQDIQFDPVSDKIIHIDFYQLQKDKEITIEVPIQIEGTSPGIMAGGTLRIVNRKLKVKALPDNLPDFVPVDISGLEMGNKLYVTKLAQDKYKIMHPDNTVVCQVRVSRAAMKAAQDAAKAEKAATKK
ncbi:50S ribosomal protein L25/general stress protein Ctc [Capnocytophaga ochracea]|uniref:Large ribosomal subunit protein bL25 n=1 Tax=Capnocytophaga ochracea F0287 TaxID=873517 RepID=E4MPW9_CAPOC|nr:MULTISPECIES: 50S ribosomal protein L25/general stress protein Ctc [Capnocytophaga]ALC96435.1 50S ribosomal protein L25 [Capnocytophaga sp. oral taxon 323]EFS98339.1 ribosomal protein L25, Ctc-form [Capnocytophaga ochracea F0287]EJF45669.1 ribosomal protein L25, Ctc-form [Capnocytophaga ochracea str. Holt 25]MEB3015757.1 50S ribosomal protein L25/general stress protein Ctc [Capnocytophaga ochracea]UEB43461.1 50S ribosomal protein L25/general stress protein Ctc [Capnocytophaga ochracea]